MPVVAFANSKGGSGKTTSALLLACELSQSQPVTLIDADPRHPITTWSKISGVPENLTVVTNESERTILDEIEHAASHTPFVIIDLEGTASRLMSYAISQADFVVIPLKEQQQDALAAIDVIEELKRDMRAAKKSIPFSLLFTQSKVVAKSRTARHISRQLRDESGFDVFQTEIYERDAFAALYSVGGTLRTLKSSDVNNLEAALGNSKDFADEVIAKLRSAREKEAA